MTRSEAKARGAKRYFTGVACPHGHVAERFTSNGGCIACSQAKANAWYHANGEQSRAKGRAYRAARRAESNEMSRAWHHQNKERSRTNSDRWIAENEPDIENWSE